MALHDDVTVNILNGSLNHNNILSGNDRLTD